MAESYNSWEKFYHRLNLIFNGIVASSLVPFSFAFLETQKESPDSPLVEGSMYTILLIVLLVLSTLVIVYYLSFRKRVLEPVKKIELLPEQLKSYLKAKLKTYGLLESVGFIALIGLYVTKDQLFSFVYVVVLFIFSLGRPTYDLVVRELALSKEKEVKLRKGEF